MGNTYGLPDVELTKSPSTSQTITWENAAYLSKLYGNISVTMTATPEQLVFKIKGTGTEVYDIYFSYQNRTISSNNGTSISTSYSTYTNIDGTEFAEIKVIQLKESTPDKIASFDWTFAIQLTNLPVNLTIIASIIEVLNAPQSSEPLSIDAVEPPSTSNPTIQVRAIPLNDFQDLASVVFRINDGKKHSCVKSCYKQLIGPSEIHVLSPFITCYLSGTGDFATDKMASVNGTNDPVWPRVSLYAMVKFILNRLMNHKFDMSVVLRKNTKHFLKQLANSDYSNFLEYFELNKDLEKYFLFE